MAYGTVRPSSAWHEWTTLVLGGLLFIAPWILGFAGASAAAWNAWIGGLVVVGLSVLALVYFQEWEEWLNAALGVWLVLSPWLLSFTSVPAAFWSTLVLGALICVVSAWKAYDAHGGGRRPA